MPDRAFIVLSLLASLSACTPAPMDATPSATGRSAERPAERPAAAVASSPVTVELVLASGPAQLDENATRALVERVEKGLAICSFSSEQRPEIFGGGELTALWQTRQQGPHLRLVYASPTRIDANAGELVMTEVMLSVGQPYGPEPALMKGERGVVGLKKCGYDDRLLGCVPELAPHFPKPAACPPGM